MKNIPNKIYLNIDCDEREIEDFKELSETTWSEEKMSDDDIEYQRRPIWHDLVKGPQNFPLDNINVIVILSDKQEPHIAYCSFLKNERKWFFYNECGLYDTIIDSDVLAWMEIPKFNK